MAHHPPIPLQSLPSRFLCLLQLPRSPSRFLHLLQSLPSQRCLKSRRRMSQWIDQLF